MFYITAIAIDSIAMVDDTRKLSPLAQESLRKRVVKAVCSGKRIGEVAEVFSVSRQSVSQWIKIYKKDGIKGLASSPRGIKPGQTLILNGEQSGRIRKMIVDNLPEQLKMPFALWTRKAVRELIYDLYGFWMPIRTVGDYLKRWGFSPQRPAKSSYEQQPGKVQKWLDQEYPKIQERAKKEKAQIHWGDETGFKNDCQAGRSYSPKGNTPVVPKMGKKFSANMISTITNQGKVRFMIYDGKMNAQVLIRFLKRLIQGASSKVFLILDNLKVHHAILVREWVDANAESIELFFLPAYSPELNPDEYLNCDVKINANSKRTPRTKEQLKGNLHSHMRMIQRSPGRVVPYFKNKYIKYAA